MISRDYTNEIGMTPTTRSLPAAVAYPILAVLVAVAVFCVHQMVVFQPAHPDAALESAPLKVSSR